MENEREAPVALLVTITLQLEIVAPALSVMVPVMLARLVCACNWLSNPSPTHICKMKTIKLFRLRINGSPFFQESYMEPFQIRIRNGSKVYRTDMLEKRYLNCQQTAACAVTVER